MNILTVIQRYDPVIGGSEILTKRFMDYLSKNHNVTVYTTTADDIQSFWNRDASKITEDKSKNNMIKRYDFLTPTEIRYDKNLFTLPLITNHPGPFSPKLWNDLVLKKIDYDLIYVTSFPYDHVIPAYVAAKKWNIPLIIWPAIHQEFPELYLTSLRLTILNNSDAVFVQTHSEKKILMKHGVNEDKISIIYPIIFDNDVVTTKHDDFKKRFLPQEVEKFVLFVGSKSYVKGIFHLIEAMKTVWSKKNNIYLVLIGPSTKEFGEYFKKLSINHKKKIIDLGVVSEEIKQNAYSSCEFLAMPSISESFGLVYLEAWTFQKPVIGCNIPSSSELIDDKKTGILVEFGNTKQLSEAIIFLNNNPLLCEKYGKEGKKKIALYDSKKNLKIFEEKCILVVNNFKNKKHL